MFHSGPAAAAALSTTRWADTGLAAALITPRVTARSLGVKLATPPGAAFLAGAGAGLLLARRDVADAERPGCDAAASAGAQIVQLRTHRPLRGRP